MTVITLHRPTAGTRTRVSLDGRSELIFSCNPAEATFSRRGSALRLRFGDGASIEIQDFFSEAGIPSLTVILADGMRMDAVEFLALFAPTLSLPTGTGLSGFAGGNMPEPARQSSGTLAPLAAEEEDLLFNPGNAQASDAARRNLVPVYQDVVFRDGEITIGPSIYGNLLPIGGATGLHIHLDNREAEMLDMDSFIARLPGLFPEESVAAIAVTGGPDNRVILNGANLSAVQGTVPLDGLGTTQFDRYAYRHGKTRLTLYLETILALAR